MRGEGNPTKREKKATRIIKPKMGGGGRTGGMRGGSGRSSNPPKNNKPNLKRTARFGAFGVAYLGFSYRKLPLFGNVLKCLFNSIILYKWCPTHE